MISLRYHIVSISAVFLALALGVVLGSTTLSNTVLSGLSGQRDQLATQVSDLQAQRAQLQSSLASDNAFAQRVAASVVKGTLAKRTVALITTPGARPADRDALVKLIKAAGGSVTTQLQLTDAFTDPNRSDDLRNVVTQVIPAGVQLPTDSDPGTISGGLLGSLLLLNKSNNKPQANSSEIAAAVSALTDGGFVKATGTVVPAQLAIVLTAGNHHGAGAGDRASSA
ncbi:MAG: copper transporter, partial [Sciscionella sp.]